MDPTADCEAALVGHWSQLGGLPGATLHDDRGLVWFETPVRHLPYNGVVRIRLDVGEAADDAIADVMATMRRRGAQCWWAVPPTATPADVGERLAAAGLRPIERMNFMALDLAGWTPPPADVAVDVRIAADDDAIRAYTELTLLYWEIPADEQHTVAALLRAILPERHPGARFVASLDGRPVGKAYLSFTGSPGVAGIYGMSVRPEARGGGVAGALTRAMIARAAAAGCHRIVLHATDMAVGVYARAGFTPCGGATIFATAELWSRGAG